MAKKPTPSQPLPTASYPVLKRLRHDGDDYAPGDYVDLTADQAAELLRLGVVAPAKPEPAADAATSDGAAKA